MGGREGGRVGVGVGVGGREWGGGSGGKQRGRGGGKQRGREGGRRVESHMTHVHYRRPLFNCEILIIANCEVFHNSQLLETQ